MTNTKNDIIDYTLSAITGGAMSVILVTVGKAFVIGIFGALGGLFCKYIVKLVRDKYFRDEP